MKSGFFISCKENDMYFVTDEPKLFNSETGTLFRVRVGDESVAMVELCSSATFFQGIYHGTRQGWEDFIYSLAGGVGAVNPMAKAGSNG